MKTSGWIGGALLALSGGLAQAQETEIERQPNDFENFTTANTLRPGTWEFELGFHQTNPGIDTPGTANQVYFVDVAFAPFDGLEFGIDYMNFVDPPPRPIAGAQPDTSLDGGGARAKLRLYRAGGLSVAAQVSAEMLKFDSAIFGGTSDTYEFVGSAHLPVTYDIAPNLQAHLTPGVSVFPGTRNGNPFYGTVASIGAGLTWKPTARTTVYGTATMPVTGANTILSDGSYARRTVLTLGSRFAFAPNSAVEIWATNGFGATPTTGVLTMFPDADIVMIGAKLVHTFGKGTPDKPHYDRAPGTVLTSRQQQLAGDGFTLTNPRTRPRGTAEALAFYGMHGNRGAALTLAPDHFLELRASYEEPADDGSGAVNKVFSDAGRWSGRFKLQFMDQADGWPVSLGYIASFGRDRNKRGVFFTALPVMREVTPRLAVMAEPKAAFYGNNEEFGLGLGANFAVSRDISLVGEYTVRNSGEDIWSVGAKTRLRAAPVEIGLHATNAIGSFGVNTMTSQDDPKVVLSVSFLQGLFR